jgi:hypothetical protein
VNYLLLLGAGFSRNWGGWLADEAFEYLLGCKEIVKSDYLKWLLWKHKRNGGFEAALAEVQEAWVQESQQRKYDPLYFSTPKDNLDKFESALERMFTDMNQAFSALATLEFQNEVKLMVRPFLAQFDAIFTLNQDLLLETHYLNHGPWASGMNAKFPGCKLQTIILRGQMSVLGSWFPQLRTNLRFVTAFSLISNCTAHHNGEMEVIEKC